MLRATALRHARIRMRETKQQGDWTVNQYFDQIREIYVTELTCRLRLASSSRHTPHHLFWVTGTTREMKFYKYYERRKTDREIDRQKKRLALIPFLCDTKILVRGDVTSVAARDVHLHSALSNQNIATGHHSPPVGKIRKL